MNVDTFANFLLAVIILLQLVGMILFLVFFRYIGTKAVPFIMVAMLFADIAILDAMEKVKVYDKNGNPVNSLDDIIGDVIAVMAWSAVASVILVIVGLVFALQIEGRSKVMAVFLPLLATATFYGAFAFVAKVCK
jgi:hypothetical protein